MTISMMSCLRLNTPDSYAKAKDLYENQCNNYARSVGPVAHSYAWLCYMNKDFAKAFEVIASMPKKSILRTTLLVTLFVKMDRVNDALLLLEAVIKEAEREDSPLSTVMAAGQKVSFSVETVNMLTSAVEARKDKSLMVRLASLFSKLDRVASISEKNLYETITSPIDSTKKMRHQRKKYRLRMEAATSTLTMDHLENDYNEHEQEDALK